MDELEFFDRMYQLWTKTTWAKDAYWKYEEETTVLDGNALHDVSAVNSTGDEWWLGGLKYQVDAEFITAIHGCFGDIYRRVLAAFDEADRLDEAADERECRILELEVEILELQDEVERLSKYDR